MSMFSDTRPIYGQDPFVVKYQGHHLLIQSEEEKRITVRPYKDDQLWRVPLTVWDDPTEQQVWAPELHQIGLNWLIYYSASDGVNANHRTKVICAMGPFGPYHSLGNIGPDIWGIDMTVFEHERQMYAVWSGWENNGDEFPQHLYIAEMWSPFHVGPRIRLASPTLTWESSVRPIMEGPQVFHQEDRLYLTYAANASWTQDYATGLMELRGPDPLKPGDWYRYPVPMLLNGGHGCVVDDQYIYHRKMSAFPGWNDREIVSIPVSEITGP